MFGGLLLETLSKLALIAGGTSEPGESLESSSFRNGIRFFPVTRIFPSVLRLTNGLNDGETSQANEKTDRGNSANKRLFEFEFEFSSRAGHDESIVIGFAHLPAISVCRRIIQCRVSKNQGQQGVSELSAKRPMNSVSNRSDLRGTV